MIDLVSRPAKKVTLPGVPDDTNLILNALLQQLADHTPGNLLRASYYDGKRALRQVGSVIPPQYYRLGLVLGWSAKAVDILARRCNLDTFVWPDGDLSSLGFQEVADGNQLGPEVTSGTISSLIHGPSFLVNTLGDPSIGEPRGLIHVKDAMNATGFWNARTRHLDCLLSVTLRNDEGDPTGLVLYLDGETVDAVYEDGEWQAEVTEHPWGVPAEALVYKPRVGRPFGSARISRSIMSLHDQALRTIIRMEGHADVYSFPEMWLLGADESIFKNPDGSQKPAWQIMLGRIKGIPDDDDQENPRADVKQFSASSPQPHIDQLKWQAQMFAGEASISVTSLGVADTVNPSSADAIAEARSDLIAEAEGATEDWSLPLRRAVTRALAMANGLDKIPPEWATIEPKWRNPLHLSKAAQADAGMKQLAAMPWLAETEVGLELLGLDEQQIRRALADRRRAAGRTVLADLTAAARLVPDADAAATA